MIRARKYFWVIFVVIYFRYFVIVSNGENESQGHFFLMVVRASGESTSAFMAQHGSVKKIEMFPVG